MGFLGTLDKAEARPIDRQSFREKFQNIKNHYLAKGNHVSQSNNKLTCPAYIL